MAKPETKAAPEGVAPADDINADEIPSGHAVCAELDPKAAPTATALFEQ